jgi:glucose 1-dehydrogenase
MGLLKGKVAIVTGASSGIGRAIARRYAAEGASVVIADIVESPIEGGPSTVDLIGASGGSALYLPTDISDWRAVDALVAAAVGRLGRLDVMVNNAAIYASTNLIETTPEQWGRVIHGYPRMDTDIRKLREANPIIRVIHLLIRVHPCSS